jgi:transcriptional regulator with XRE-family HTH domain
VLEPNNSLAAFLRDRRGRVEPDQVGLPPGRRRRVRGLRREEVAQLAGLSVDYYARLEQGRQPTASPSVLRSVARTLRLTEDETRHLFTLAHVAAGTTAFEPDDQGFQRVRRLVATLGDTPAQVIGPFVDILMSNPAATFLFGDFDGVPPAQRNGLHRMLLVSGSRDLYGDEWESATIDLIGMLRLDAAEHPGSSRLAAIVAELSERSALFREQWRDQAVSSWQHHHKVLRHPAFGEMAFTNEFLTMQSAPGLRIVTVMPDEPSRFEEALFRSTR